MFPDVLLLMIPVLGSMHIDGVSEEAVALAKTVGGGGVAGFLFKYLLDRVKGADAKIDAAAAKAEAGRDAKLDLIITKCSGMDSRIGGLEHRLDTYSGVVKEVKDRVEGVSNNHGPRLGDLEQRNAVLEARVDTLEADNREIRAQVLGLTGKVAVVMAS